VTWLTPVVFVCLVLGALIIWRWEKRSGRTGMDRILFRSSSHPVPSLGASAIVYAVLAVVAMTLLVLGEVYASRWVALCTTGAFAYLYFYERPRRHHKFCATIVERHYRVCPKCVYDLRYTEAPGRCPECGKEFSQESLEHDWCAMFPSNTRAKLRLTDRA